MNSDDILKNLVEKVDDIYKSVAKIEAKIEVMEKHNRVNWPSIAKNIGIIAAAMAAALGASQISCL